MKEISFEKKTISLEDSYAQYNQTVKDIAQYLKLVGMFEVKDGQSYSLFNDINEDPFTWKEYPLMDNLVYNSHNMMEIQLNVSDVVLLGSDQSIDKMIEVISSF